jgi:hypothetical protein
MKKPTDIYDFYVVMYDLRQSICPDERTSPIGLFYFTPFLYPLIDSVENACSSITQGVEAFYETR